MSGKPYIGPSEAQSRAEAARRSATYADEHARTWTFTRDRGTPPEGLRALVISLRRAYRDEVPTTIHKHALDAGGGPAYSGEFAAYLFGSAFATDKDDDTYHTPVRACLVNMLHSHEGATQQMGRIAAHVIIGGDDPVAAVSREIPVLEPWVCRAIAERALLVFWRRCSEVRLDLRRTRTMVNSTADIDLAM